jgi:hypothetical protein
MAKKRHTYARAQRKRRARRAATVKRLQEKKFEAAGKVMNLVVELIDAGGSIETPAKRPRKRGRPRGET